MDQVTDEPLLVARVAGLDIGKASLQACIRVPSDTAAGRRMQEVRSFATTTPGLLELADWLRCWQVEKVVMESTSNYWRAPYYLLEAEGFAAELWNAAKVKAVPGRAKTDRLDAIWLAMLAERGLIQPSFVPPRQIRELRTLTRYRRTLTGERTQEKQRVEKLLEDACIKLSVVASDIFGKSGRDMLDALIAGQRDPKALAQLARRRMRSKIPALEQALTGHFSDQHGFVLQMMLANIDHLTAQIQALSTRIEEQIAPFAPQVAQLDEVTGIGVITAQDVIAEIGTDMTVFPTSSHLVSWAKYCPQDKQSGTRKGASPTGHGNPYLAAAIGEAAISAARTNTFPGERYRRVARRRGKKKALVATGNTLLTIIHHLLSDPTARYTDLGPGYYTTRMHRHRQASNHIHALQRLGFTVTVTDTTGTQTAA